MSNNSILNKAKYSENTDEWYTDYETVATEVANYKDQFYNKIVLCNCDDPYQSAFANYFLKNFKNLQLKKLICTSYKGSRIVDALKLKDDKKRDVSKASAYVMEISEMPDTLITDDDISNFLENNKVVVTQLNIEFSNNNELSNLIRTQDENIKNKLKLAVLFKNVLHRLAEENLMR